MERSFFERDTLLVAEELVGCYLVRQTDGGCIRVQITETEAYKGSEDPASHAWRGVTPRNRLMFGEVGLCYVYFIYGMHYCMNVVAHPPGGTGAVLLRGAAVVEGESLLRAPKTARSTGGRRLNGPAKLTRALGIGMEFNGVSLIAGREDEAELRLEQGEGPGSLLRTGRIGISRAAELPWRFVWEDRA